MASTSTLPPTLLSPHLTTILTTSTYIPGVLVLLKSLITVFHPSPSPVLIIYVTSDDLISQIISELSNIVGINEGSYYCYNLITLTKPLLPEPNELLTEFFGSSNSSTMNTTSNLDAPRRLLFLLPIPICYIDCDTVIVSPKIQELLDLANKKTPVIECHAVGNYRNKKKEFVKSPPGNFNCGVTVVTRPEGAEGGGGFLELYKRSMEIIEGEGWNDTEEKMLNLLFPNWVPLRIGFNLQKRAFWYGDWNRWVDDCVVIHYVGGKPWVTKIEDWEENDVKGDITGMAVEGGRVEGRYGELFRVWREIIDGGIPCRILEVPRSKYEE